VTVTVIKEAGHTAIQPLLCCVAEAVTVMTGLAVSVEHKKFKPRYTAVFKAPF